METKRTIYLRQVTSAYMGIILVLALFFILIGWLGGILTNLNVLTYVIGCDVFAFAGILILRSLDGSELEELYFTIAKFKRRQENMKTETNQDAQCMVDNCDDYQTTQQQNQDLFYPTMDFNRYGLGLNF